MGRARQTSSLFLKLLPFWIFEDWPFSLYIVTASESDKVLVILIWSNPSPPPPPEMYEMTSIMRQKTRTMEQEEQSEENLDEHLDENLYKHSYELSDKQSVLYYH